MVLSGSARIRISNDELGLITTIRSKMMLVALAAIAFLIACGGSSQPTAMTPVTPTLTEPNSGQISMGGGGALGGNAATTVLAQIQLEETPTGPLAWVTHRVELEVGEILSHSHGTAFVYAESGAHTLITNQTITQTFSEDGAHTLGRQEKIAATFAQGEGSVVSAELDHLHEALETPSTFLETRLARPGSALPGTDAPVLFESPALEGIPDSPLAVFVLVVIPPGGETSVHTHPGPEFIYQLSGGIDYQNGIVGVRPMTPGDVEGIPPVTSVQKRNPSGEDAAFLSWFLVDPSEPFASPAFFPSASAGPNLALLENGATVADLSSNFGGVGNDSTFGAANALDGDPGTEWSSASDGDQACIDVELATVTDVTSVGFWTRTMGNTAQVNSFQVTTDRGETYGPFSVDDATTIYRFDTSFTAKRLRFELLDTTGGNTGALEIEVYGEPVP